MPEISRYADCYVLETRGKVRDPVWSLFVFRAILHFFSKCQSVSSEVNQMFLRWGNLDLPGSDIILQLFNQGGAETKKTIVHAPRLFPAHVS
jgi:hypothetical protein